MMTKIVKQLDEDTANFYRLTMQYTVRAAALATGVTGDRLRTWERRYGIPAPARADTGRRLYEEADLDVIRRMTALVDSGLSAASAAAAVLAETAQAAPSRSTVTPTLDPRALALVDSVEAFDESSLFEILDTAERAMGIEAAVEEVALPALVEAGRRWERSDITVAGEHLLAEVIRAWFVALSRALPAAPTAAPRVLVACPEDERHDLGALALALLLRRAGLRVAYLGADVPTSALVDATRSASFAALCLSVTGVASLPVARLTLRALLAAGRGMRLYVGGPAIIGARDGEADALPAVRLPASVSAAARQVAAGGGTTERRARRRAVGLSPRGGRY